MFLRPLMRSSVASAVSRRSAATTSAASSSSEGGKWELWSAVVVERVPTLTKDLGEMETAVCETLREIEEERSIKCNFELRLERDLENAERKKKACKSAALFRVHKKPFLF